MYVCVCVEGGGLTRTRCCQGLACAPMPRPLDRQMLSVPAWCKGVEQPLMLVRWKWCVRCGQRGWGHCGRGLARDIMGALHVPCALAVYGCAHVCLCAQSGTGARLSPEAGRDPPSNPKCVSRTALPPRGP